MRGRHSKTSLLLTFRLCVVSLSSEKRIRLKLPPPSSPLYILSDKLKVDLGKSRRIFIKKFAYKDPGSGAFWPGSESRMDKHPDLRSGSGVNIPDLIFENLVSVFWVKLLKFFYADTGPGVLVIPGSEIQDGKYSDPGSG
jgi:hypothetical protein